MSPKRVIKVFLATPGDLAVERRAFKDQIEEENLGFGAGANVEFTALGWEDTFATAGRRAQGVINAEIDSCHVFVLAMWRRWGQEAPDSEYDSYTEEEFHRALARFKKDGEPEVFIFFKHVDSGQMADPGKELTKVKAFRLELEQSRQVLYHYFADEGEFKKEISRHLRAYARGELPKLDTPPEAVILPIEYRRRIEVAETKARKEAERAEREHNAAAAAAARAEELALTLARGASQGALDGRIEEARQYFAKATDGTANLDILSLAFEFFNRIGELAEAERLLRCWLAISGPDAQTADTAAAYGNLGVIYKIRGDLELAETVLKKALEIDEKLGRFEGMASNYGNLGNVYLNRGDLDQAETMHKSSLEINRKLGRLEGMANDYGNLGVIHRKRGDLDQAETMHKESLKIFEKLGALDRQASVLGNLGVIQLIRGDPDLGESMLKESLRIFEKLGRLEGMANQYANLGTVAMKRGNLAETRKIWTQSRDLYVKIGIPHKVQQLQSWLDGLSAA